MSKESICNIYWSSNWCDDWCPTWQQWKCEQWDVLSVQNNIYLDIDKFSKIKDKFYNNNNTTMINNLDLKVLKEKFQFDITKAPKIESDVSFEALQNVLAKSNEFSWATDLDWDIVFMVTADNYTSFEVLLDAWLLDQECILLKDNVKSKHQWIQVKLSSIDWWEKKDPNTSKTIKEQNLYMFSDDDLYHGYIPDGDTRWKKYGYYMWEVHNTNWFYSVTLLFRVAMKTAAVKRKRAKAQGVSGKPTFVKTFKKKTAWI